MADLIRASSSKGTVTLTESVLRMRIPGSGERAILRSAIVDVSIGLSMWYGIGFLRKLTLHVNGEPRPIVLANMRKSKARAIKAALGF